MPEFDYYDNDEISDINYYTTDYQGESYSLKRDGPARILFRKDGSLQAELWNTLPHWSKYSKMAQAGWHREDGPAIIKYDEDGEVVWVGDEKIKVD